MIAEIITVIVVLEPIVELVIVVVVSCSCFNNVAAIPVTDV